MPSEINDYIIVLDARTKPEIVYEGPDKLAKENPFNLVIVDTFAAFFDGDNTNYATQGGEFMRRMRPFTRIEGRPATLVAAHPVKNAPEDNLLPYGSGAILNEVDGNLTVWKNYNTEIVNLHWQGKLRGLDFNPIPFRFESLSSPDLLDTKGRQFLLPVLKACDESTAEQREKAEIAASKALLKAIADNPDGRQEDWGAATGKHKGTVNRQLRRLKELKLVEEGLGKWKLSPKGEKEVSNA